MRHCIQLEKIEQRSGELTYFFKSSSNIFKKDRFFVRYEGGSLSSNESINSIPFAAVMAPISWMTGADLFIPRLDQEYILSLGKAREYFQKWFSGKWSFEGRLTAQAEKNEGSADRDGMLFSGGLDSLTTYARHRDKKPILFSILGIDIPLSKSRLMEQWKGSFLKFCEERSAEGCLIFTDLTDVIQNQKMIRYTENWWGEIAYGLALTSLTAPISHSFLRRLWIASGHKDLSLYPSASNVELDRHIRWSNTHVDLDNFESGRLEKVLQFKKHPELYPYLRVCFAWYMNQETMNCGKCEKCLRTVCGLLLNNIDPADCNIPIDENTLGNLKKRLSRRPYVFFENNCSVLELWREIQKGVHLDGLKDNYGSLNFFRWLADYDDLTKMPHPVLLKAAIALHKTKGRLIHRLRTFKRKVFKIFL